MRYALLVSVLLYGCCLLGCSSLSKPSEADQAKERVHNIERVLAADKGTSTGVKRVSEIVARMRAISLTGCPTEFSSAYVTHIHAWEEMAEVERDAIAFDANFNSNGAMVEAFVRGLMLDPFGKVREGTAEQNRLRGNYQRASTKIRETFHRVEEIAVTYGATLPARK